MKCIIPCAGLSTRMNSNTPKPLIKVNGHPLLHYITDAWMTSVERFIIIANSNNEPLLKHYCRLDPVDIIVQREPKGLADAILQAEPYVGDEFIVALGDCLYLGTFDVSNFKQGIGVWRTKSPGAEIFKNYLVEVKGDRISQLTEKPKELSKEGYCGMGVYFLNHNIFPYLQKLELTEALQAMIEAKETLSPVWFNGDYINVTYPEDLTKAKELLERS